MAIRWFGKYQENVYSTKNGVFSNKPKEGYFGWFDVTHQVQELVLPNPKRHADTMGTARSTLGGVGGYRYWSQPRRLISSVIRAMGAVVVLVGHQRRVGRNHHDHVGHTGHHHQMIGITGADD